MAISKSTGDGRVRFGVCNLYSSAKNLGSEICCSQSCLRMLESSPRCAAHLSVDSYIGKFNLLLVPV